MVGAMSFVDSGLTFNNSGGEGCTFIDIDQDGDLDLYTNRTGNNRLYINQLGFFKGSATSMLMEWRIEMP